MNKLYEKCQTCRQFAKTPPRPAVSLPMENEFNDKVALDLKIWKGGKYILHMIDMFSQLSICVYWKKTSKRSCRQNYAVLGSSWLGCHEEILFENRGEFSNHEMREELLNVETCTTLSESPWSNGLCERNHQIID